MSVVQLVALLPIAALMGNEAATLLIHRGLFGLKPDEHLAAEQAIHRVLGSAMPPYMIITTLGAVVLTVNADDGVTRSLAAAVACLVVMLAVTLIGNVPINNQTVRQQRGADLRDWRALRVRWNKLHLGRVVLDVAAFLRAGSSLVAGT